MKLKMFSCKQISKISCSEEELTGIDKLNYRMHLMLCAKCKKYVRSLRKVEQKFRQIILNRSVVKDTDIRKIEDEVLEKIKNDS
ncbi:hypothetical protein [Halobacteriovorax sp. HLS]|uniref:hypothetical protein n=1 Tax=Halobacteriovorax sp. HLS TaxID=2234000 RepID=UPI000FD8AF56|nr:hypothetical protein [Halobacteriovorax sp. HLS]